MPTSRSPKPLLTSTPRLSRAAACFSNTGAKKTLTACPKMIGSIVFGTAVTTSLQQKGGLFEELDVRVEEVHAAPGVDMPSDIKTGATLSVLQGSNACKTSIGDSVAVFQLELGTDQGFVLFKLRADGLWRPTCLPFKGHVGITRDVLIEAALQEEQGCRTLLDEKSPCPPPEEDGGCIAGIAAAPHRHSVLVLLFAVVGVVAVRRRAA